MKGQNKPNDASLGKKDAESSGHSELDSFARKAMADDMPFFVIPRDPENDEELPTDRVCYGGPQIEGLEFNVERMLWNQEGGKQILRVTNRTPKKMAFKLKCSDNNVFRVSPVFGTLNSEQVVEIEIHRKAAAPLKEDKIVFCYVQYEPEETNLEAFFKKPTTITENKNIYQSIEYDEPTDKSNTQSLIGC